jgi:hypothetical protein
MNIRQLKEVINNFISNDYGITIHNELISSENGLREYNSMIRMQVLDLTGIYLWENADNNEVLYVGMAGKVNQQGILVNHSVRKRLQASRGKNPETGREIQTNQFIRNLMLEENCNQLNIHIIHLHDGNIPGYVEAVLVNAFYQRNGVLPRYNNAF